MLNLIQVNQHFPPVSLLDSCKWRVLHAARQLGIKPVLTLSQDVDKRGKASPSTDLPLLECHKSLSALIKPFALCPLCCCKEPTGLSHEGSGRSNSTAVREIPVIITNVWIESMERFSEQPECEDAPCDPVNLSISNIFNPPCSRQNCTDETVTTSVIAQLYSVEFATKMD